MSGLSAKKLKILKTPSKNHPGTLNLVPADLRQPALKGDITGRPLVDEPTLSTSTFQANIIKPKSSPTKAFKRKQIPALSIKTEQAPKSQPLKKVRLEDEIPVKPKVQITPSSSTDVKVPLIVNMFSMT